MCSFLTWVLSFGLCSICLSTIPETINSTLPRGDWGMAVGYSKQNNVIFYLGGIKYPKQLVSFNQNIYQSDAALTDYGQSYLPNNMYFRGQGYTQNNDILYMINPSGTHLSIFNLSSLQFTSNWNNISIPTTVGNGACLTIICVNYLIICGGKDGSIYLNQIQIYNIDTQEWLTNLPNMNNERDRLSCIISTDNKYLYAIGGRKNGNVPAGYLNTIEKLYIGNILYISQYTFQLLNVTLKPERMEARAAIYANNIYIVGGTQYTTQIQSVSDVDILNTTTDILTEFNKLRRNAANPGLIIVDNKLIVLGAYLNTWVTPEQPRIQVYEFSDTTEYIQPMITNYNCPTLPTTDPTVIPTTNPAAIPSMNPSTVTQTLDSTSTPSTRPTISNSNYVTISEKENEIQSTQLISNDNTNNEHDLNSEASDNSVWWIYVVVAVSVIFVCIVVLCILIIRKKRQADNVNINFNGKEMETISSVSVCRSNKFLAIHGQNVAEPKQTISGSNLLQNDNNKSTTRDIHTDGRIKSIGIITDDITTGIGFEGNPDGNDDNIPCRETIGGDIDYVDNFNVNTIGADEFVVDNNTDEEENDDGVVTRGNAGEGLYSTQ